MSLCIHDRFLDRVADLGVLALSESDVSVTVTDDYNGPELDTATGVGHPLYHIDVEHLIHEVRKECVNDLRFFDGFPTGERLVDALDLTGLDHRPRPVRGTHSVFSYAISVQLPHNRIACCCHIGWQGSCTVRGICCDMFSVAPLI